jgi:ribosomal protein S26
VPGFRWRKKPLVCVDCGREITRDQAIRVFRGFRWRNYHETCAAEAGLIDAEEFGWPLRGPERRDRG